MTRRDHSAVRLTIPAKAEYITLCRLALTEACSNSVRHAYSGGAQGVIEIVYELRPDRLAIEVADDGDGFDPAHADPESPEAMTEGGLGIAIIRSIADELEIGARENGAGSRLRFVKLLRDAA
jgi:serine/threonine-protein kinase RsbW